MRPEMRRHSLRCAYWSAALCILFGARTTFAQTGAVAVDVVGAVDGVVHSTPARPSGVWLDVFAAVRIVDGLDFVVRPVISRRTFDGGWQKQMYQLGFRYERRGASENDLGLRVEVGQMPSPIGIGMLENRADLNPLISQHSAYYLPLPRVDPEIPRSFLIAGAYPFGAQATLSTGRWDARVALIDSSPVRGRPFFGSNKPPRLMNTVFGGGITPRVGLRFGVGVARGAYASAREVIDRRGGDRLATMVQAEGEWSFGHTRIVGELVRSVLETARADATVGGAWIELSQTLNPRLFVAARVDTQQFEYPAPGTADFQRQHYQRVEGIVGVRVTPDLTLRGGYLGRKGYVVSHWDDQLIGSIVWQRKLW
jgi:hypothetical protein